MKNVILLSGALLLGCVHTGAFAGQVRTDQPPRAAQALIQHFHMENIPHEGPWFAPTFRSNDVIDGTLTVRYPSSRRTYNAIYFIMTHHDFSAMHRLTTDEIWHYYGGNPAMLLLLYPDGHAETRIWGNNVLAGQEPQILVPHGTWMGAIPIGAPQTAYTFGGNTLSPGFEYEDYEQGYRNELTARYPEYARQITELTRQDSLTRPPAMQAGKNTAPEGAIQLEQMVGRTAPQKSKQISGTRFVIAAGHAMPMMMTKKGHEIMFVASGQGSVQVGNDLHPVTAGSVIYLPPRIPHSIRAVSSLTFYVAAAPAWRQSDTQMAKP